MEHGKFDEELARMSAIADLVTARSLVLFNESFAATNEREGSEIARQIVQALIEHGARVVFVTHMYEFAHEMERSQSGNVLFLRADRAEKDAALLRLREAPPLPTSYGLDLYRHIFEAPGAPSAADG